ncbi:hypothetical protein K2173_007309 [Erythroxylum novogranatense]|uniref:Uncharacterized protein n=1 Tax=Erythroxylum novogranatense TaxID=1862640 RepID=A0AAV8T5U6_9ROSI|nr:hypothetical protein K2173_007309 [Erythroxylum novogranatense]
MMGRKKPQKTKELSVAIAEASSTGDETKQQHPETPRKRGRPRKMVEKIETEVKKKEPTSAGESNIDAEHDQSKKVETSKEEDEEVQQQQKRVKKKEGEQSEEREPPRRSRRRKSQPRKSC